MLVFKVPLKRFVLVKYLRAFVERPLQGTSSLALQLTTVSLDLHICSYNKCSAYNIIISISTLIGTMYK